MSLILQLELIFELGSARSGLFLQSNRHKTVLRSVLRIVLKGGWREWFLSELWQMHVQLSFLWTSKWKWHIAHICTCAR